MADVISSRAGGSEVAGYLDSLARINAKAAIVRVDGDDARLCGLRRGGAAGCRKRG